MKVEQYSLMTFNIISICSGSSSCWSYCRLQGRTSIKEHLVHVQLQTASFLSRCCRETMVDSQFRLEGKLQSLTF